MSRDHYNIYNAGRYKKYETITRDDGDYFLNQISNMSEYMNVKYEQGEVVIEGTGQDEFIDGLLENRIVQAVISHALFEVQEKGPLHAVSGSYKTRKQGGRQGTNPKISIELRTE